MAELDPPAQQSSQDSADAAVAALHQDPDWLVSELARRRGGGLALAVATLVALLGFGAGWLAVKDDIAAYHSVGLTLLGLYRFPLFVSLISAALTYGVVSRLANGPSLSRNSYELFFPTGTQPWPRFGELRADLAKLGYRLSAHQPNLAQDQPMSDEATLDQGTWWIREATNPSPRAAVVLRLTPERGQGCVAIADTSYGLYGELAKFLIVALGRKVPELTFKETASNLSAESWEWLPPQLPDTPRALPASRA